MRRLVASCSHSTISRATFPKQARLPVNACLSLQLTAVPLQRGIHSSAGGGRRVQQGAVHGPSAAVSTTNGSSAVGSSTTAMSSMKRLVPIIEVDASGRISEMKMPISRLKEESRLHMRELIIVEQPAALIQPRILPRRHSMVLTIGHVRAVIFVDRVYLFGSSSIPGVKEYAQTLAAHIQQQQQATAAAASVQAGGGGSGSSGNGGGSGSGGASDSGNSASASTLDRAAGGDTAPFELMVMEHALLTQTKRQTKRVQYAKRLLDRLLSKVGTVERDDGNLSALFPLANTILHFEMVTRGICDCIRQLLDDDRDMKEACLSEKAKISHSIAAAAAMKARAAAAALDPHINDPVPLQYQTLVAGYQGYPGYDADGGSGGGIDEPAAAATATGTATGTGTGTGLSSTVAAEVPPGTSPVVAASVAASAHVSMRGLEGSESFMGHAQSPIAAHRHLSRVLQSSDGNGSGNGYGNGNGNGISASVESEFPAATATATSVAASVSGLADPSAMPSLRPKPDWDAVVSMPRGGAAVLGATSSSEQAVGSSSSGSSISVFGSDKDRERDSRPRKQQQQQQQSSSSQQANKQGGNGSQKPRSVHLAPDGSQLQQQQQQQQQAMLMRHHSHSHSHSGGAGRERDDDRLLRIPADALSQLELMLESIYHMAAESNMSTVELSRTIKAKQDLLELQQSNYRNFILSVTLRMSVLTVSITTATFITSAFGQNLASGLEGVPGLMYASTAASGAAGWLLYRYFDRYTMTSSPTQAYARRLQTLNDFLYKLDSKVDAARSTISAVAANQAQAAAVAATGPAPKPGIKGLFRSRMISHEFSSDVEPLSSLLTEAATGSDGSGDGESISASAAAAAQRRGGSSRDQLNSSKLSKADFRLVHERMTGRPITEEEVEILFDLLDADADGKLRLEEVEAVAAQAGGGSDRDRSRG